MSVDKAAVRRRGLSRLEVWPSRRATLALLGLGLVVMIPTGLATEARFARTGYPGGGFGGPPLTLDPDQRRAEYEVLAANDTLETFRQVQTLDTGIIVGTLLVFSTLALLVARRHPSGSRWGRVGLTAAVVLAIAPVTDALENITLLSMLTDPAGFPDWLGRLNSTFSLAKTTLFVSGWLLLVATAVALAVALLRPRPHPEPPASEEATDRATSSP